MSITSDKLTSGEWNPDIYRGRDFKATVVIAVNGVVGYAAGDTFVGNVSTEVESATGVAYTITLTDPANGVLTVTMSKTLTANLVTGDKFVKALFHDINWTILAESRTIPIIIGRPNVYARAKI